MAKAKTATKTAMVTQPGGRGALLAGGMPGNAGGGRPKEILRRRCREEIESRKGIEYVASVMDGTAVEKVPVTVGSGKDARVVLVDVSPKTRDRLYAYELLMDRGYGKPDQALQVEDERPRRTGEEVMADIMEMLPRVLPLLPVDRKEIARLLGQQRAIEVLVSGQPVKDGRSGNGNGTGVLGAKR